MYILVCVVRHAGRRPSIVEWAEAASLSRSSLKKSLRDYEDAKQRIINSNIRLVYHVARKLNWGTRLTLEDLVQVSCLCELCP